MTHPSARSSEVETDNPALEVRILWGDESLLHVAHLRAPHGFVVGESSSSDYLLGRELLGCSRLPLVLHAAGRTAVVIPENADATIVVGDRPRTLAELTADGALEPLAEVPGALLCPLPAGASARVSIGPLTFVVQPTLEGRRIGLGASVPWRREVWTGASIAIHAAFLLMFYLMPPRPPSLSPDLLAEDSRLVMLLPEPEEEVAQEVWHLGAEAGTGARHEGEQGTMGERTDRATHGRYAIEGPPEETERHMAAEGTSDRALTAGAIGVLRRMSASWSTPTSPYGWEAALGAEPSSALGALMGDQVGESFGFGGLGMRGVGRGGGGTGAGVIGLGELGTLGHGAGLGDGQGSGYGASVGGFRGRVGAVPRVCGCGPVYVRGGLSREAVRRVIRRHVNEVRFCYEQRLAERPDLAGRVTVSLVISGTGVVQSGSVASTTLHDGPVEGCVAQAARRWSFPAPDGGSATLVTYPFVFESR